MKVILFLVLMLLIVPGFSMASESHVMRSEVSFSPVTFSLGCKETTALSNRRNIEPSKEVVGYIKPEECIDTSRQVVDARVIKLAIGKNEGGGNFSVILVLDDKDAKKLAALTQSGNPQVMVLSVKGRAVVSSFNNTPFKGNQFWITAASLEDARKTADLFNQ